MSVNRTALMAWDLKLSPVNEKAAAKDEELFAAVAILEVTVVRPVAEGLAEGCLL